MAKRDFSKVTPESVAAPGPRTSAAPAPSAGGVGGLLAGRRRWYLFGAVGVVLLVILAIGVITKSDGSGTEGTDAAVRTVHGPTAISDGIPSGYTRDKGGAATAAVNLIQVADLAKPEQADKLGASLIAAQPSDALKKMLDRVKNPSPTHAALTDVFNNVPATVTVRSITPDAAEVSVWTMSAGTAVLNAAGQKAVTTYWSTTDVSLVWQAGDWKAKDWSFRQGPEPAEVSAPSNQTPEIQSGYFSFYVN